MLQRVLVLGLIGALALIGGCASGLPDGSKSANTPATSVAQPTEPTAADKAGPTKQVTLSVSGMT